jgi:excisionase family DNA binding protein
MEAAKYLGVSRVKLSQLARDGVLPFVTSPLDKRVKLFKRSELNALKAGPRWARGVEIEESARAA